MVLAALLVVGADRVLAARTERLSEVDNASRLFVQPRAGGVYLLGNSMFKTGVDPAQLQSNLLGTVPVDFEYHNGHYTNLWYLIAKSALGRTAQDPAVVVWGFRPYYARMPAFRQNRLNDTDIFTFEDALFESLSSGASFTEPKTLSSAYVKSELDEMSGLYRERDDVRESLNDGAVEVGVTFLEWAGVGFADRLKDAVVDGDRSLADEITRLVTDGEVVLTEELVVDNEGDFVTGPNVPFREGFIPPTAEAFRDAGLDQLVIIWRPITAAQGAPIPEEAQFVEDALAWFEAEGIPALDLYHDDRIQPVHYGAGDHYNEDGRRLITKIVAEYLDANFALG